MPMIQNLFSKKPTLVYGALVPEKWNLILIFKNFTLNEHYCFSFQSNLVPSRLIFAWLLFHTFGKFCASNLRDTICLPVTRQNVKSLSRLSNVLHLCLLFVITEVPPFTSRYSCILFILFYTSSIFLFSFCFHHTYGFIHYLTSAFLLFYLFSLLRLFQFNIIEFANSFISHYIVYIIIRHCFNCFPLYISFSMLWFHLCHFIKLIIS